MPGTFCNHVWNSSAKLMINAVPASLFDLGRNKRNTGRFHYTLVCPLKLHPEPPLFSVIHLLCYTCAIGGSLAKQLRFSVKKAGQPMVDRFAGMAFPKNVYLCCPQSGNHVILESHRFIQNFPFGIIRSGDLVTEGEL